MNNGTETKIGFFIGGTGLGNASRCVPIIGKAILAGQQVFVASSSFSADLIEQSFPGRVQVLRLQRQVLPNQSALSMLRLLLRLPRLLFTFLSNFYAIAQLIRRQKIQLAFVDSEYSALLAARLLGLQTVVLNQGLLVKQQWARTNNSERRGLFLSFYFLEFLEDMLYRTFAHKILVPTPLTKATFPAPYFAIAPPIRESQPSNIKKSCDLLYVAGGSGLGDVSFLEELSRCKELERIVVIGRVEQNFIAPNIEFHGLVRDSQSYFQNAKWIVAQGGYSSLMDLIYFGKPALLMPICGHAEQHMNAQWAEDCGFAVACRSNDSVTHKFSEYCRKYDSMHEQILRFRFSNDGAAQALSLIEVPLAFGSKNEPAIIS